MKKMILGLVVLSLVLVGCNSTIEESEILTRELIGSFSERITELHLEIKNLTIELDECREQAREPKLFSRRDFKLTEEDKIPTVTNVTFSLRCCYPSECGIPCKYEDSNCIYPVKCGTAEELGINTDK